MKRNFLLMLIIAAFSLVLTSCIKKDKDDDGLLQDRCNRLYDDWIETTNAFIADMNEQTCEDNKDAYEDFINGCSTLYTQAQRDAWQESLDSWDCSVYGK